MKKTVGFCDFTDAFRNMGRESQFSYNGLRALFDWLEELDESCGKESELDVIGLCCDWCEVSDMEEFREAYGGDYETQEEVEAETIVIPVDGGGFIYQAF